MSVVRYWAVFSLGVAAGAAAALIYAPQTGEKVQVVVANTALNFAGAVSVDPTIAAGLAG